MAVFQQQEGWAVYKILDIKRLRDLINEYYDSHDIDSLPYDIPIKQDKFILLKDKLEKGLTVEYLILGVKISYLDAYEKNGIFRYIYNLPYRSRDINCSGAHTRKEMFKIIKKYKNVINKDKKEKTKFYENARKKVARLEKLV